MELFTLTRPAALAKLSAHRNTAVSDATPVPSARAADRETFRGARAMATISTFPVRFSIRAWAAGAATFRLMTGCALGAAALLGAAAHAQQNVFKSPALPNSVEVRPPLKGLDNTKAQIVPAPGHVLPAGSNGKVMQQTFPGPGSLGGADECTLVDFSDEQLAALKKLVVLQLKAQGGDVAGFISNDPPNCRRKQMIYYMKSVVLVSR
jgi:hypothetical protein